MSVFTKLLIWASNLKAAITILFLIALASAIGTTIPQNQEKAEYINTYNIHPWIGLINGDLILKLELDHIYSSNWFLILLIWLSIALMICTLRRQLPTLKAALLWTDYKEARQLSKFAIAETIAFNNSKDSLKKFANKLEESGWDIRKNEDRFAARKGIIGRVGPPLVHIGLVVLMIGAAWGFLAGQKVEQFITPGRSITLLNKNGSNQISIVLKSFFIDRDPLGRIEQFRSDLELRESDINNEIEREISVNHPLRYKGVTIYQADWSLESINLRLNNGPLFQIGLKKLPELGDEIWGVVLPTTSEGKNPILISLSRPEGPIRIFNEEGQLLGTTAPKGAPLKINNILVEIDSIKPSSGLLIKRDPGIPMVYIGFTITLIGGTLSIITTRQIWVIEDAQNNCLHIGGLCNRNISGLAKEIPQMISTLSND